MGSRDLQPEGLIGTIENMLPDGKQKKLFYLSIDFIRDQAFTPKQEIYQQQITEGYPKVKELSVRGSENPNLMPKNSITARFHSIGGWGAITTGKNLAMTLFDLLGYHIKANPKYGSEKKGQPTTYYLSAAPEPIKINCEYYYVDVVLSPDPAVLKHTNALAGLKKGGVFIIQSDHESAESGLGRRSRQVQEDRPGQRHQDVVHRRIQDRPRGSHRPRAHAPHAGYRLPGRLLQGLPGHEERRIHAKKSFSTPSRTSSNPSSAPRAHASSRTTSAWSAEATTSSTRFPQRC